MDQAVGALNLVLGSVYTSYGLLTLFDLWRNRAAGRSHFGMAWVAMAFTCGPHHLDHGLHALVDGHGGPLDLLALVVGFPAGVVWFLLRLEAVAGGRGDRVLRPTPPWVEALPTLGAMYLAALAAWTIDAARPVDRLDPLVWSNVVLIGLYAAIGAVVLRTQILNHRATGSWSLSGLSLGIVFPTCAAMHLAWALYASAGAYPLHWHLVAIDTAGVPAAAYFLWVVWALHRGTLRDWRYALRSPVADDDGPMALARA